MAEPSVRRARATGTRGSNPGRGGRGRAVRSAVSTGDFIGGATGGLLGALTNAGISEEDAQVFVEGVRRGGTVVAARVPQGGLSRIVPIMNQSAVNLQERSDLYRKSGWQSFDPNAVPYTADQVRSERALHAH